MKKILIKEYNNLVKLSIPPKKENSDFFISFCNGAKLETKGRDEINYNVKFIDQSTNEIIHESNIHNNMWTKTNLQYFKNWYIKVINTDTNELCYEHKFNAKDKRVYIHFASKALGDTIAWFPYAEEFRKKHKCELIVSTFHNYLFKSKYPEIEFIGRQGDLYRCDPVLNFIKETSKNVYDDL